MILTLPSLTTFRGVLQCASGGPLVKNYPEEALPRAVLGCPNQAESPLGTLRERIDTHRRNTGHTGNEDPRVVKPQELTTPEEVLLRAAGFNIQNGRSRSCDESACPIQPIRTDANPIEKKKLFPSAGMCQFIRKFGEIWRFFSQQLPFQLFKTILSHMKRHLLTAQISMK